MLSSPSIKGDTPDDREGHTASVIGPHIVIFGGTWTDEEDNTLYMNDLHALDTTSRCWNRPLVSGIPPIEREGHTAASIESTIYIFGGVLVALRSGVRVPRFAMAWARVHGCASKLRGARARARARACVQSQELGWTTRTTPRI